MRMRIMRKLVGGARLASCCMLISTRTCAEHVARCAFNRVLKNCSYSLSGYTYARLLDIFSLKITHYAFKLLRGYVSKSSAALNPLTITWLACELSMRGRPVAALPKRLAHPIN